MKSPSELSAALTEIVARACKCETSWAQHSQPVTWEEYSLIHANIAFLLMREREIAIAYECRAIPDTEAEFRGEE